MFGVSFLEIAMVALVALVVVGPQKLPGMMRTAGEWMAKLRRLTSDMRAQTGIDDILREEGIDGVQELRTLLKGQRVIRPSPSASVAMGFDEGPPDILDEFPVEGPDAAGALPDDLLVVSDDAPPSESCSGEDSKSEVEESNAEPQQSNSESGDVTAPPSPASRAATTDS